MMEYQNETTLSSVLRAPNLGPREPADQPTTVPPVVTSPRGADSGQSLPTPEPLPTTSPTAPELNNTPLIVFAVVGGIIAIFGAMYYAYKFRNECRREHRERAEHERNLAQPGGTSGGNTRRYAQYFNNATVHYHPLDANEDHSRGQPAGADAAEFIELSNLDPGAPATSPTTSPITSPRLPPVPPPSPSPLAAAVPGPTGTTTSTGGDGGQATTSAAAASGI
ncbi:hypothetical protein F5Y04DRAFT_282827 [Hypomontagnella monticulosa]|nr:hypothetical protein F5Y04DRAFT_282827 [Hypomontagnella monticulosa]